MLAKASLRVGALLIIAATMHAQEDAPPAGRGGRGGRGRGGPAATRDFLGLGPAPDEAAAKKGEPLYQQNCATCHGATARGAQAPNLVRSPLVLHDEKGEGVGPVIRAGRPQAGMPAYPNLSADDIYNISQFPIGVDRVARCSRSLSGEQRLMPARSTSTVLASSVLRAHKNVWSDLSRALPP